MSRIDGNLIISFIPLSYTQIIVLDIQIKIRKNKFIFYKLPDNAGHLIAIQLHNRVFNRNFFHYYLFPVIFHIERFYL